MSFSIQPTQSGGIIARGSGEYAKFDVEWDVSGKLVRESVEIRNPGDSLGPTPEQVSLALKRAEVCESCEHNRRVTLSVSTRYGDHPIYKTGCDECRTCGSSISLISGKCPKDKWPKATE